MEKKYQDILEYRNSLNHFAIKNNAKITKITEGYAEAEMTITNDSLNPIGSVHGGAYCTVADIACGGAASSYGTAVTTVDLNIHFIRAGLGTKQIIGKAKVHKRGKKIITLTFSVVDENDTELCMGTATFAVLNNFPTKK